VGSRCQIEHFTQHKSICKSFKKDFAHCVVCDRTVSTKVCNTCSCEYVCDRNSRRIKHAETCVAPCFSKEQFIDLDVVSKDGILYLENVFTPDCPATTKNIIINLWHMKKIPDLIDRDVTAMLVFEGGWERKTMLKKRSDCQECSDGAYRTIKHQALFLNAHGIDNMPNITAPVQIGWNRIKLVWIVIPAENTWLSDLDDI